jgi:hypothetical protein
MLAGYVPYLESPEHVMYRQMPAILCRAPVAEGRPLPLFGGSGTGGLESEAFYRARQGYQRFEIVRVNQREAEKPYAPFADLMEEVKNGFGRTMVHLPSIFGVSRQTLYNWLAGETPKEQHQGKVIELAAAARVFIEAGFKPTPIALERTVADGKSLLKLLGEGAHGAETAKRLIRIVERGNASRKKLDALLGDRKSASLQVSDMGAPSLREDG